MVPFVPLAAAALFAQAAAAPLAEPSPPREPVQVEAAEASWDAPAGEVKLTGRVALRRGHLVLRAPEALYRPATGEVEIPRGALLVEGARAIVARALRGEVGGLYEAEEPAVYFVDDAAELAKASSPEEAARVPRRRLTLHADHASGRADGGITLSRARFTLCSCGEGAAPSWELRASSADVRPGERAILSWPVLWITPRFLFIDRPVPVLALPWLWMPLGERQSGLLLPEYYSSTQSGSVLLQPLFLTLGRSADATAWAGWAFGGAALRGFTGALEVRWTPAEQAAGRLRIDYLHDLEAEPDGTHGARVAVSGLHAQRLGDRTDLRLELELVGDPLYVRDFTTDVLLRGASYRRSALLVSRRGDDSVVEASGAWLLPQALDSSLASVSARYGLFGSGLPTFHRGPSLAALLLPTPVGGAFLASGRAELARFGPLSGTTSDGGVDGIGPGDLGWSSATADGGQLDGRFEPGERLAATRASLRAELSAPLTAGRWLRVAPFLRGAMSGYAFDAASAPIAAAWLTGGAAASTELSRRFGVLRHSIVPRLEWRLGSRSAGGALPAFGYDQWDRGAEVPPGSSPAFAGARFLAAAPHGVWQQGRASLETRLDGPEGELLRFQAGQDFDAGNGELAESWAALRASAGPVTAEGTARYLGFGARRISAVDPTRGFDDWTEVRGTLGLHGRGGSELHGSVASTGSGGSPMGLGGVDALFDLRPTLLPASAQANAGFRLVMGPMTIAYDLLFPPREVTLQTCDATGTRQVSAFHVQQQTATFVWSSPCRCFRAALRFGINDCATSFKDVSFKAEIDLSPSEPAGTPR